MTAANEIVAVIGALLALVAGFLLFRRLKVLPANGGSVERSMKISVIIPARDEEENLGRLLPTLSRQVLPPFEVIVVDDQSSDGTAELARREGARVVSGSELPAGWYGKPWACHQGAEVATGEWLLFLDADLELEPDALQRWAVAVAKQPDAVFSVCPWHRIEKPYEELSVFFNLLMVGGIGAFTWRGEREQGIGLFGQTMLLSRARYDQLGGHEAVKQTVLENFHLSRKCSELGIPRRCHIGRGAISMRMFPGGFREMVESWAKGFSSGAGLAAPMALLLSAVWLTGLMMLTVCLFLLPLGEAWPVVLGAYLVVAVFLTPLFRKIGRFSPVNALLFPISLLFYQWVFGVAVLRKRRKATTQWKGRDVG